MPDYYYTRQGKVRGPLPLEQIVKYVKARKLPVDTQVCVAGKKEWKSIQSIAPDTANLASNAKIVGMTIGGAAGLILLLVGVMWLFRAPDPVEPGTGKGGSGKVAGGGKKNGGTDEQIVTEFTVMPGSRKIQKVKLEGKEVSVLLMDVDLQSPDPVQIPLTPKNVYIRGTGKRSSDKSNRYYIAPKLADYEMETEGDVKTLAMGREPLFGFDDGEMVLKLEGVKKYRIKLMFFDPPGENVVLHFPPSQPWGGPVTVAAVDGGKRPAGGDPRAGTDEPDMSGGGNNGGNGGKKEEETIVVGNVPDNFAFMPLSKVKDGDIADIKQVLAAVTDMQMSFTVDSPEEAQVALVSGDDVITGLYGEGLRLFPEEAGAEVKMWITEPFAAYRKGTLIAVYDPTKEKFRYPRDDDGVPPKIETPTNLKPAFKAPGGAPAGGDPAMTPMAPEGDAPAAGGTGATMAPEMMEGAAP